MLIPYVFNWGKRNEIAVSKLLIPLSYACILGGSATLIGTSTNLIVNGLAVESGIPSLGIFDFSYVGVPLLFLGIIYILLIGHRLLPDIKDAMQDYEEHVKEYLVETEVTPNSPLIGKRIIESQNKYFKDLFIMIIFRDDREIVPVKPQQLIRDGDKLIFSGQIDTILDIVNENTGLKFPAQTIIGEKEKVEIVETVVSHTSELIGKKVRDTNFPEQYDAAIVAVHRHNAKIKKKISDIVLHSGDTLLLIAGEELLGKREVNRDLYIISKLKGLRTVDKKNAMILTIGMALAILVSAFNLTSLFNALLVLISVVIFFRLSTIAEFIKYIDLDLLAILGFALAMGTALVKTGADDILSEMMINMFEGHGTSVIFGVIFIVTNILGALMTNKAAVAVIFPIAISIAAALNLDPVPFVLAVAYGGSASFITPIGYQTNLMVYGPGGYSFADFMKIGLPLTLIYMIGTALILEYVFIN